MKCLAEILALKWKFRGYLVEYNAADGVPIVGERKRVIARRISVANHPEEGKKNEKTIDMKMCSYFFLAGKEVRT